jgi:enamine deaminase RidA (YjgF/YER057c/UK114 family)
MKRTIAAPEFAHYPQDWHLAPVLLSGDFAFLSGQTGTHPDGTVSPDPEQQFRSLPERSSRSASSRGAN